MTFRVNDIPCDRRHLPAGGEESLTTGTLAFLREWFDNRPSVTGHTSGTTGPPRPCRLLKSDMRASAALSNARFGITGRSTLHLCLSPAYIAGKMMIVRALIARANLLACPPSGDPLLTLDRPVDLSAMVPFQVETILARPGGAGSLSRVRQLLVGGAPLSPSLESRLQEIDVACHASYGMTETVSHVALRPVNGPSPSPWYEALGDTRFAVDTRGCLLVDAPHLRQRYFTTNDLVRLRDDRSFEYLGRLDNVINSGGIKHLPETIERQIAPLLPDTRFFIAGEPHPLLGQQLVLVIEDSPWDDAVVEALADRLSRLLPPRACPRSFRFLENFRETPSGKLSRAL